MNTKVQKSKNKFHKALLSLLKEQPLADINVSQLCRKAGLDRNTFYSHYDNTADILEEIMSAYEFFCLDCVSETAAKGDYEQMIRSICTVILENPDLQVLIGVKELGPMFLERVTTSCSRQILEIFSRNHMVLNPDQLAFADEFATGGTLFVLTNWCRNGMKTPVETVAKQLGEINTMVLNNYLQ